MKHIEIAKLHTIAGGICSSTTCYAAERALYNQNVRPDVIKEALFSGAVFGVITASLVGIIATPVVMAGTGIATSIYVAQDVYNHSELWI